MRTYIAVDLGGTNIRVALVSEELKIVKVLREKSVHGDTKALRSQISRMIGDIISIYDGDEPLRYVGISAAGFCEDGVLKYSPNLQIGRFDLASYIQEDFPKLKALLCNDANCSALMESLHGASMGTRTSFFFTVSSGIGCGLIYNNELIDLPLEGGHTYIGYNRRFYELEQLCSGNGIVNLAKINGLDIPDAATLFAMVGHKDRKAMKIYDDWLKLFGSFVANVQLTYNPEVIVMSGGVMKSKAMFLDDLLAVANAFVLPFPVRQIRFAEAAFDQDTGIMGATAMAISLAKQDTAV